MQVTQAQTTANSFDNDVYQATSAINSAQAATTTTELNSGISQANSKLSDAQKQFNLLKKSNVQSNGNVKKAFCALSVKWTPYQSFLQSSVKDTQALAPVLIQFGNATDSLSNNAPTDTAGLATYLSSFKQTIDTASQQASTVKIILPEDKELLTAFQADLQSSSQEVAKAQSDLSSGSDSFTVEDDLFKVDDSQTTFETAANKASDDLNTKQGQLDPGTAYNNFLSALNKISTTVKS
jgi:hypothetical protein